MSEKTAKAPLEVKIERGVLSITIGVDTLAVATENCPALETFYDQGSKFGQFEGPKVFDPAVFAQAIMDELQREEEDGTTPVHVLLDKSAADAISNGADGIRMPGDG